MAARGRGATLKHNPVARLVEACRTGERCLMARGIPAISPRGFTHLAERGLWSEASRAVIALDAVHPRAQLRAAAVWMHASSLFPRDDYAFLRKVLPAYDGPGQILFRGQLGSEPAGACWTSWPALAVSFAVGSADATRAPMPAPRQGGAVLMATVPAASIISSPRAAEFVVDPGGIQVSRYRPADVAREVLAHGLKPEQPIFARFDAAAAARLVAYWRWLMAAVADNDPLAAL